MHLNLYIVCLFLMKPNFIAASLSALKQEQEEFETSNIDILQDEARKLPIEDFIDDPELTQHVDYVNKKTEYKIVEKNDEGEVTTTVVYERNSVDKGQMVVVLTSSEDNIKVIFRKRTYVVLRQNPLTNRTYFASYAYIRHSSDSECVDWDGEPRCIEWDTWDNARGVVKSNSKYFGWTHCASSFLASCTFNESHEEDSRNRLKPSMESANEDLDKNENTSMKTKGRFLPCPGYEEDDSIDVFADLDVDIVEAQYIGEAIKRSAQEGVQALLEKTAMASSGRSFSGPSVDSEMTSAKENAKVKAKEKGKKKKLLKGKLADRNKLLGMKKTTKNQLMKIAKAHHLGSLWKIKKDEKLMAKFKTINGTENLLKDLTAIENELKSIPQKTEKEFNIPSNSPFEVAILQGAEEEPEVGEMGDPLGSTLAAKAGNSPSGRSLGTEAADALGKSVAKGLLSTTTDLFSHPGWKMQTVEQAIGNVTLRYENITFFGFGGCKDSKVSSNVLYDYDMNLSTLIDFYLQTLKTSCTREVKEYILHLIRINYLERDVQSIQVPRKLIQLTKKKLNTTELQQLSSSFELSVFTKTFLKETNMWIYDPVSATDQSVSRSIYFIVKLGLNFIQEVRRQIPTHLIKLCRNLVLTLKMTFTKLLQDYEMLRVNCPNNGCQLDLEINSNDRDYVYGLMEFILRALRSVEMGENAHHMFHSFYDRNYNAIHNQVNLYI